MYEFHTRVRYSELDEHGRLSLNGIINDFQDTTNFHSLSIGMGLDYVEQVQQFWMLVFWQIVIDRYPTHGEEIRIGTQAYDFSTTLGLRNFAILDAEGTYLVKANSIWTLIDGKTGHPMRIPMDVREAYGYAEPIPMEYAPRKIKLPKGMTPFAGVKVTRHMIDSNHHVNNGQYVQIAADLLPADVEIRELRVEYKRQAVLGEEIIPYMGKEDGRYVVSLCGTDGKPYAVVALYPRCGSQPAKERDNNGQCAQQGGTQEGKIDD